MHEDAITGQILLLDAVATVIFGGLLSTTLLEFLVCPALFGKFGRRASANVLEDDRDMMC